MIYYAQPLDFGVSGWPGEVGDCGFEGGGPRPISCPPFHRRLLLRFKADSPSVPPNRNVNPVLAVNDRYSEGEVYGSFLTKTLSYPSIHTVGRITFRDWGYRFDPFKRSCFPS